MFGTHPLRYFLPTSHGSHPQVETRRYRVTPASAQICQQTLKSVESEVSEAFWHNQPEIQPVKTEFSDFEQISKFCAKNRCKLIVLSGTSRDSV
jgi:hypothetical protein